MAETREVFTPLENAAGSGIPYIGKAPGAAQSTEIQAPVLPCVDESGNLQNIPLNSDGEVAVGEKGTPDHDSASATIATLNTEQTIATITVAVDDIVNLTHVAGSASQPMLWIAYGVDDGADDELYRFLTGPGAFNYDAHPKSVQFVAGATGAQTIELRATQLRGALTDAHAVIAINNLG